MSEPKVPATDLTQSEWLAQRRQEILAMPPADYRSALTAFFAVQLAEQRATASRRDHERLIVRFRKGEST